MEVTRIAAWAVVSLCALGAVYGLVKAVKAVVAWLRSLDEDDGWFDDADEEPEEADDARGA